MPSCYYNYYCSCCCYCCFSCYGYCCWYVVVVMVFSFVVIEFWCLCNFLAILFGLVFSNFPKNISICFFKILSDVKNLTFFKNWTFLRKIENQTSHGNWNIGNFGTIGKYWVSNGFSDHATTPKSGGSCRGLAAAATHQHRRAAPQGGGWRCCITPLSAAESRTTTMPR